MERKVILNMIAEEKRGAIIEKEKVVEWLFENEDETHREGSIIVGKVMDVIPGMEAAFVDIGEEKNGFLYRKELKQFYMQTNENHQQQSPSIRSLLTKGQTVVVQVKKEAADTKGARLTELLSLPGKYTVYLPYSKYVAVSKKMSSEETREYWRSKGKTWVQENEGLIIRTISEETDEEMVFEELDHLRRLYKELKNKAERVSAPPQLIYNESSILNRVMRNYFVDDQTEIVVDQLSDYKKLTQLTSESGKERIRLYQGKEDLFSAYKLDKELEKVTRNYVWLKNGAFLIIEKTEALTVIDVNTGKYIGKENLRDTILKTNIEAANAVAQQLRLRNIGGIVLIDFIDMKNERDKEEVLKTLKAAVKKDKTLTNIGGFTQFGLVEMTRKKTRKSVEGYLLEDCPTCRGTGKVPSIPSSISQLERDLSFLKYTDSEAIFIDVDSRMFKALTKQKEEKLKALEAFVDKSIYVAEDLNLLGKSSSYVIRSIGEEEQIRSLWERKNQK